jgi:hypothetical protein
MAVDTARRPSRPQKPDPSEATALEPDDPAPSNIETIEAGAERVVRREMAEQQLLA